MFDFFLCNLNHLLISMFILFCMTWISIECEKSIKFRHDIGSRASPQHHNFERFFLLKLCKKSLQSQLNNIICTSPHLCHFSLILPLFRMISNTCSLSVSLSLSFKYIFHFLFLSSPHFSLNYYEKKKNEMKLKCKIIKIISFLVFLLFKKNKNKKSNQRQKLM